MHPLDLAKGDFELHAANDVEQVERRIMELALEATGARNGAIFLWDEETDGLAIDFHVVEGLTVNIPNAVLHRREGRPNGVAFRCFDSNAPVISNDTSEDPSYAPYYQEVLSIAAVPIPYQGRPIGVISASSTERNAYNQDHIQVLLELAEASALFLRRAQLYRASQRHAGRPFLIKGLSPEWLSVERRLESVSPTDAPVLIQGESGTGKELVAHAIHFNSRRADKPFVAVNCAAIPETMLESILFGHVKGAFTGATFAKVGEFKKADGGTLFLDEVGELPIGLQSKVLRAVEQGEVQPLGSNRAPEHVDVRFICATNRDLNAMMLAGSFRTDLYYRLSVMTMELPPLRTYKDNLEVIAQVFLQQAAKRHGKRTPRLSAEALALLHAYDFPGNVRELKNLVEHAVIVSTGAEIGPDDFPPALRTVETAARRSVGPSATLKELRETWLAPLEKRYLITLLEQCNGNVRKAAERAGVNPVTMYRLLNRRGLKLTRQVRSAS